MPRKILINTTRTGTTNHIAGSTFDTVFEATTLANITAAGGRLVDPSAIVNAAVIRVGELRSRGEVDTATLDAIMMVAEAAVPVAVFVDTPITHQLLAGVASTNLNVWTRAGSAHVFPTVDAAGFVFGATLERSDPAAFTVECKLYNRTLGADVAGSLLTLAGADVGPTFVSAAVALPAAAQDYDVLYRLTAAVPGPADTAGVAGVTVSYTLTLEG